eukprot:15450481-Alexandrium_andersonii.AAC.1
MSRSTVGVSPGLSTAALIVISGRGVAAVCTACAVAMRCEAPASTIRRGGASPSASSTSVARSTALSRPPASSG